jgi:hypothetical protein
MRLNQSEYVLGYTDRERRSGGPTHRFPLPFSPARLLLAFASFVPVVRGLDHGSELRILQAV